MTRKNIYESRIEINPMTKYCSETESFSKDFFGHSRLIKTIVVNGDLYL
jgi:hypothetical protein